MNGGVFAFGLVVVLLVGATVVGKLFGPRAEMHFQRGFWIVVFGVVGGFVGLVLLGLIWTTIASL